MFVYQNGSQEWVVQEDVDMIFDDFPYIVMAIPQNFPRNGKTYVGNF